MSSLQKVLPSYPQTPKESMEFLSRLNWNLEISKALFHHSPPPYLSGKVVKPTAAPQNMYRRLFSHKEECNNISDSNSNNNDEMMSKRVNKKDKARVENAHTHSVLCVAGLAAAVAGAFDDDQNKSLSSSALASATQLLASYCIEMAQESADRERVACVVRSALASPTTPTHLSTLTAAAATALRGEAALRGRLPNNKRSSSSSSVSPYEKVISYSHSPDHSKIDREEDLTCQGDLLQLTSKGMLRWRHVAVYINKAYQVTIKLKSKHVVGGAFSKNNKCVVYEVIEKSEEWPFKRDNMEFYFGLKTSEGLLELKCKNKVHKQRWVHGIHKLLRRRSRFDEAENSLRMLHINKSI